MKIKNKVILVTGASSGIGESFAYEASKKGAKLILCARRKEVLESVKSKCAHPENVKILQIDLENTQELFEKSKVAIKLFGHIDILVNNAGISQRSLTMDTKLEVDQRLMNTNYIGTVALSKFIIPQMLQMGAGQIVTVTSMAAKYGTPLRSTYAATKHALHGFMDSLRAEISSKNIVITLICPGFVATNVSVNALVGDGTNQGTMDKATQNGIKPDVFAKKMIAAIEADKAEAYIAGFKERLGLLVSKFCPPLFRKLIQKMAVT